METNKGQSSPSRKHVRHNLQGEMMERPLGSPTDMMQIADTARLLPCAPSSYPRAPSRVRAASARAREPPRQKPGQSAAPAQPFSTASLTGPQSRREVAPLPAHLLSGLQPDLAPLAPHPHPQRCPSLDFLRAQFRGHTFSEKSLCRQPLDKVASQGQGQEGCTSHPAWPTAHGHRTWGTGRETWRGHRRHGPCSFLPQGFKSR